MAEDVNIMIAGEASQGTKAMGHILTKIFTSEGYHVFLDRDYESRIRGGHRFCRIR